MFSSDVTHYKYSKIPIETVFFDLIFYLVSTRKLRNFQNAYFANTTNLCVQHLYFVFLLFYYNLHLIIRQ
jgi:hypothetical protein